MEEQVIQLEYGMWEAASNQDTDVFRELVAPDAVMVCGGYRCLGSEYAELIRDFNISGYAIRNMEVISSGGNEVLLHYIIRVDVADPAAKDLEGEFHIASMWKQEGGRWRLAFNMDSRIAKG